MEPIQVLQRYTGNLSQYKSYKSIQENGASTSLTMVYKEMEPVQVLQRHTRKWSQYKSYKGIQGNGIQYMSYKGKSGNWEETGMNNDELDDLEGNRKRNSETDTDTDMDLNDENEIEKTNYTETKTSIENTDNTIQDEWRAQL
ncbi:hypothetical protein CHS0354_032749 [Potamilus streckersoni]|uniref:Uncharacterized protein n=1 Tax=Potamilus streckersoni TaxID=2493646 RepID=A0AAE0TKX8_9BIVA|nr:hypothetical protein CHS0354_032749 [Potamilus streckersoni]